MPKLILLSGVSKAGSSTMAIGFVEKGYRLVENLPNELLPSLIDLIKDKPIDYEKTVLKVDLRHAKTAYSLLKESKDIDFIFILLDCSLDVIRERYRSSRLKHPLEIKGKSFEEALQEDQNQAKELKSLADLYIDTTALSDIELRKIALMGLEDGTKSKMVVSFCSFGFKYGDLPKDAKIIFDARAVPNPYWVESLKSKTGLDKEVIDWLEEKPVVQEFYTKMSDFLDFYLSQSEKDNRNYIFIYVGCTGGQHRSVYYIEKLYERYKDKYACFKSHREIGRYVKD